MHCLTTRPKQARCPRLVFLMGTLVIKSFWTMLLIRVVEFLLASVALGTALRCKSRFWMTLRSDSTSSIAYWQFFSSGLNAMRALQSRTFGQRHRCSKPFNHKLLGDGADPTALPVKTSASWENSSVIRLMMTVPSPYYEQTADRIRRFSIAAFRDQCFIIFNPNPPAVLFGKSQNQISPTSGMSPTSNTNPFS